MIEGEGCARSRLGYLHEFLFGAFGADDVLGVRDEAPSDEGGLARGADEAVVVPVSVLERDEPGAANTCDWFTASRAALGEELSEAVGTVGLVVTGGEPLSG